MADVAAAAHEGIDAANALQAPALRDAAARIEQQIPCLREVAYPALAARAHLVLGLRAFVDGREPDALRAFVAARRADPTLALPSSMNLPGHPAQTLFEEATRIPETPRPLYANDTVWIDGLVASAVDTARPAVLQLAGPDRVATVSAWLPPGGDLPAGLSWNPPEPVASSSTRWSAARVGIGIGGAVALAGAGASLGLAASAGQRATDAQEAPLLDVGAEQRAVSANHGWVLAAGALALTGAGLGVTVWVAPW